jgi:hypothetical protein
MWKAKASLCGNFMPVNRKRAIFAEGGTDTLPGPTERASVFPGAVDDVRPDKVAKARQLIKKPAYPPQKVVRSLADQIARFF